MGNKTLYLHVSEILTRALKGVGITFLFCQYSFANVYYVSTTGNDTLGTGSANNPWKTLKYAVTKVVPGQGHVISVGVGIFVEDGLVEIPLGVSLEGAGVNQTIFKADSSFYYHPSDDPGYSPEKFLISLKEYNPSNGNQTLKNFTIDGDSKKLHGGIYVRYRSNVVIENVNVQYTNFSGIWLWDVQDAKVKNVYLLNCSWGSSGYSSGALNLGNLERVEIDQLDVIEDKGYGIKALGPYGYNDIFHLKIHDSHISVNPTGLWSGGRAPNIAIELWLVSLKGCEIYNCYVDNNISLVNANAIPSSGIQTIRVHHNIIDLETRAMGRGYGMELTLHDAEVDHNYFIHGAYGIVNWDNPMENWNIHHNVFYGQQGDYPGEIVRSQWSGLQNVKLYNNTIEFTGNKTMSVVGLYEGVSNGLDIRNNLVINSNTGYTFFPNEFIHTENGATINNLTVLKNSTTNLAPGHLLDSLLQLILLPPLFSIDLTPLLNPSVSESGNRPAPYYFPITGSSLIDAGASLGLPFLGSAPDIGAYEYGETPTPNSPPRIRITNPINNQGFVIGSIMEIMANASDNDGTILKVEFFNGATKLGEDLTNPYSFTWTNVPDGVHSLTARAIDNRNSITTSEIVIIHSNSAPFITITSPQNNASFTFGSPIVITVNATDTDGTITKVEFFNGENELGEDSTSPYSFNWTNVPIGNYSLTAKATDNHSAVTISSPTYFRIIDSNTNQITLYPNPTSGKFIIQYISTSIQQVQVSVRDVNSRLLVQKSMSVSDGVSNIEIDAHQIAAGVYIVSLLTQDGRRFTSGLIIQK